MERRTTRSTGPLARIRSPRPVNVSVRLRGRDQKGVGPICARRGSEFDLLGALMRGLRLALSTTLLLGGLFSAVVAEAQPAAGIARIGYLARNLSGQSSYRKPSCKDCVTTDGHGRLELDKFHAPAAV